MFGKIRPQIFIALSFLGGITLFAIHVENTAIATATIGGLIALGMKVLENE